MKKFSKAQLAERDAHNAAITTAHAEMEEAIQTYNDARRLAYIHLMEKINSYNEAINSANEWLDGLHSEAESYYDEKSEKWQEGDAGSTYQSWLDVLGTELEVVEEPDEPEDLEVPESVADHLDNLATSPDEA
jgi:hypothetical protein